MSVGQLKGNQKTKNGSGVYHSLKVNVPDHWQVVPLEEVLNGIIGGGTPSKTNPEYWVGSIPWLTVKDMRTRRPEDAIDHISKDAVRDSATNIIPADTVIIATRIGLGKVIRVPYDAAINQDLKALVGKPELEKGYLEYWILSIAEYLESIGSGTTVKGIRLEQLRSLPFPLAPPNERARIVAEIEKQFSRLDEAVANLKRVKANLKRYKASVLKAAVEGKLTEAWRKLHPNVEPASKLLERILTERRATWKGKGKYKETPVQDTTNLPPLPNTWTWSSVETVCSDVVDCPHSTPQWEPNGRVCLRTTEFRPGRLVLTDVRFVSQSTYEKRIQRLKPRENDIVYSREGGILGVACMVPRGIDPCLGQRMMLFRSHVLFTPNLLMHWLNSSWTLALVRSLTGGSASPHLNVGEVRLFPVPVAPLAEQEQIIAEVERRLSVIEELEAAIEANLTRANRLRQSILQRAFSGRLLSEKGHAGSSDSHLPLLAAESVSPCGVRS